ncbi:TetR/AcrR family transcriptional regulator [Flavobacterium sp. NRK F10]|uniref:TetR family transcriptional regulator n=1 Tax=Flavobacterium sediminis TaxID=2201181 RepID=A0A2U8QV69_9FLAO|nr:MULTISPECIES: TetR/AcrR family transcriptional regulator [Flavobacterium]AWM14058.1 TetR family transcriptional regulator [Flavobacterium sediminis]MCO6175252.1 TetR/AcrR family transcriptional regulator [Flavobacterium sp. NRK F10]
MHSIIENVKITINEKLYLKDPETSELGRKIVGQSILLINEIGFDAFTFKKLGERIQSNESSIYRYFENKHKLLVYLSSWYWSWVEYNLVLATNNIENPEKKLNKALEIITRNVQKDDSIAHIDEYILNKIIIAEFTKTFLTKEVDEENEDGFFVVYKRVINRIHLMIESVNPTYKYSKSLASSIVQGALHQNFLKDHFQSITSLSESNCLTDFYKDLIKKVLL